MQIQTTTITTETMQSAGANFQITTFEQFVTAMCDCCESQMSGTKPFLEDSGWHVGQDEQLCGECK